MRRLRHRAASMLAGLALLAAPAGLRGQSCVVDPNGTPGCPPPSCVGSPTVGNSTFAILVPCCCPPGSPMALDVILPLPGAVCGVRVPFPPCPGTTWKVPFASFPAVCTSAPIPLPIPNNPALVGTRLCFQGICFPGSGGCLFPVSPALSITIR